MPRASSAQPGFLGGEISQFWQSRFDKPEYNVSLGVCYNGYPVEAGAWVRRPGSRYGGHTRSGLPGRVIKFDFDQSDAVTLEFTDGSLRFRNGVALISTNDPQIVVGVSTASPAVVQTAGNHGWSNGNTVIFDSPGPAPLLENRQFVITVIDSKHVSLADALTSAAINGAALGTITTGTNVRRVHELATSYAGGSWSTTRSVQAETSSILLNGSVAPQILTVQTQPTATLNAQFSLAAASLNDGPYLDPFVNGVQVTPNLKSGIVSLTLSFPTWSATVAYAAGSFVTSSSVNYRSLIDQNINNTPGSSPAAWAADSAGSAIGPNGFQASDIGRSVRLYSEPNAWNISSTYSVGGEVVSYNPNGQPGAATYWQNQIAGNHGAAPGTDLTNWKEVPQGAAIWTWGRITSLLNGINTTGATSFGNLTNFGGLSAAFDGVFSKLAIQSARLQIDQVGFGTAVSISMATFAGKQFASPQRIASVTVYPSSDEGFGKINFNNGTSSPSAGAEFIINLRASNSAPVSSSNGTLLAGVGPATFTSAITLTSSDQASAWSYIWVELVVVGSINTTFLSYVVDADIAQIVFTGPPGTGVSTGINVEIIGNPLLYITTISTWQLGVYSNTTGWPTCGVYHEGRLWLGGAIGNRFDACKSGGISGTSINFSPTDAYGQVADDNAISYTLSSDSVNPIFWMMPDLQGIVMGTQGGEFLVQAPSSGSITPTNIAGRRVTKIGCANVEPRRTEHTTVFVQRYSVKLLEYFSDVFSGKFSAPNVADKAQHITRSGIVEISYQQATTPIIWGRDTTGALFGLSYKRDTLATANAPTFAAWHRHALGSGRTIESLCVGPSLGGNLDSLTMITNDASTNIRHVEVLTDALDESSTITQASYLDDAVVPSSYSISTAAAGMLAPYGGVTLNGLWHLNGKTVQVFAGGLDCGDQGDSGVIQDYTVANGSVFVPFGDGISAGAGAGLFTYNFVQSFGASIPILVGFTFTSQGQTLRSVSQQESGARNGPALGKITRNHRYAMQVVGTRGVKVGGMFDQMYPVPFTLADGMTPIAFNQTFTGFVRDTLADDYSLDGYLSWQIDRPWPANIVTVELFTATQDQ
jgi:hypothetical protein